jgi:hypothetical protein
VDIKSTLSKDVLVDNAMNAILVSWFIMRFPDFIRSWIVNPLASLITSDLLPST